MRSTTRALLAIVAACIPAVAWSHTAAGAFHGLLAGVAHPFAGLDHLLAITAVGIISVGRRARWLIPATFVIAMCIGALLATTGVGLPLVEPGIALSLVVFGGMVMAGKAKLATLAYAITAAFALLHGHAHGSELPAHASALLYAAGFVSSTAMLLVAGVLISQRVQESSLAHSALRVAGAAIATTGLILIAQG